MNIDDEFLVGENLLAAPVVRQGATTRDVYLPEGEWYDYASDKKYQGRRWISAQAPLETIPLFVKAGSILPVGPVADCIEKAVKGTLSYEVFPDSRGVAAGSLYEDDGDSQKYLKGECQRFLLKFSDGKLISNSSQGNAEKQIPAESIKVVGTAF